MAKLLQTFMDNSQVSELGHENEILCLDPITWTEPEQNQKRYTS